MWETLLIRLSHFQIKKFGSPNKRPVLYRDNALTLEGNKLNFNSLSKYHIIIISDFYCYNFSLIKFKEI